jgi:hypothetical protein
MAVYAKVRPAADHAAAQVWAAQLEAAVERLRVGHADAAKVARDNREGRSTY